MKSVMNGVLKGWTVIVYVILAAQPVAAQTSQDQPRPQDCELFPIALSLSSVSNIPTGTKLSNLKQGMQKGQFGWLTWSGNRSRQTLINSLTIPGDSYKYINTADTNDSQVSARNWVRNTQAENVQTVRAALDKIKKCEVVAPLWYQASSDKGAYRIGGFAKIQLLSYDLDSQDTITVRFNGMVNCDKGNDAPVVSAGEDLVVAFPNRAVLHGSVMDDGLPTGKELTALWTKVSGPGIVMFSNPRSPETLASFTDPGTYVLRLTGDDGSKSASDDVTVTLNFGNAAPVANAQTLDTVEDVSVNVTLTGSDADGDALTYILVSNPSFGTLDGTVPNLTYIPAPNVSGTDNFTFKVNDGVLDSEVATITINVAAVNDAPVAFNQSVSTDEDTAVAIVLSGNDVEGTALTFTIIDPPVHGVLSGTAPNLVYTPVPNYSGSDQFAFTVNDGALTSPSATVTLTVRPVNSAPIAQPDSLSLDEDGAVDILLRGSDAEGSPLTFSIVTPPAHGVLTGTPPAVRYVPSANYNGGDSFTFKVNDGTLDSAPALVTIAIAAVNDAPVALDDSVALDEDSNADLVLRGNDVEGNPLTFSILTPPAHGALSGTPPNVRYVPAGNYNGPDIFTFKANDGALDSAPATVSITVRPVNDVPVAVGAEVSLAEDSAADIVLTGTDVENSPLTFSIINHPAHGVLSGTPPAVRYVPAANYNGPDSFTFKVNDGVLDSAVATVNLVVQPVNDAPVASSASASLDEDTGVDLVLQGTDVEGSTLAFAIVNPPAHGTLSGSPPAVRYVPSANYFGPDSFTFKVNDGSLDSTSATVSLTVNPVNDAPVALADAISLDEDTGADILLRGTDVENDPLAFTVMSQPSHGVLSGTPPNVRYFPAPNYNGPDSFTFKVNDGALDSAVATVTLTVRPVNDPPAIVLQTATTAEDTAVTIVVTATDVDGDSLTYAIATPPAHGTLSGPASNVTYTPDANYFGPDSFQVRANDGTADSDPGTITINVTPVNDAPVATAQSVSTLEDTPLPIPLTGTDVENDTLTFTVTSPPENGILTGSGAELVYHPNLNFNGTDNFAFKVNDGDLDSAPAVVSITVTPVNDPPVADSQSIQAIEAESTPITLTGSDVDNDPLTFEVVTGPTNGTLTGTAPNLSYTPNTAGHPETDSFTFSVSDGVVTSTLATVTIDIIYNQPPVVSAGPDRSLRSVSEVATLTGSASDDGLPRNSTLQLSWQMLFGPGTVTFGDPSSAVTTASFSASGLYILEFSASDSQYTSRDAVQVRVDMLCSANPPGAVAWWPADMLPTDIVAGNEGTLEGGVTYTAGKVGAAFTFDGLDDRVVVPAHASLDIGAANSLTIEFWMNSADISRSVRLVGWHSGLDVFPEDQGVNIFQSGGELHAQIYDNNNISHEFVAFNALQNNVWTHIAVTYDRTTGLGRIYANGALRVTSNLGNFRPRTTFPLFFGNILADVAFYQGMLDEITLYTRALDAQEIHEIFTAGSTGKCPLGANLPPLVNAGPDVYLQAPGAATLNGSASDDGLPAPASLRPAWSVVSGPGTVTFADAGAFSTSATFDAAGIYVLRLSVDDTAIVRSDVMEVRVASVCTIKNLPGLVAWFPGNGTANDVIAGREGRLAAGATFVHGRVGGAFNFDGVNDSVRIPGDAALDVGTGSGFSIEFWMNSADITRNARLVAYHNGLAGNGTNVGVNIFQLAGNLHVQIPDPGGASHEFVTTSALTLNTWMHVAVTYDRTRGHARTYINGVQRTLANVGIYLPRTVGNLHFGNLPFDTVNFYRGLLDEVSIYNRTLDAQDVYELFAAGSVGKCPNDANQGPIVNAGPDLFLRDTAELALLNGTVADDGLPPGYAVSSLWTVVDGPGTVTFGDVANPVTTANFSAPGTYVLRLTADDALVASSDLVEVRVASLCTVKDPAGLVAWWPGNANANDVVSGVNGRLAGGLAFSSGRVSSGFRFDGSNDVVQIPANPILDVGQGNGLTLEFWVNSTDVIRFARLVGFHFGVGTIATNFGVNIYQQSGGVSAQIYDIAGLPHEMGAANTLVSNAWTHVAVTYDRTTGQGRIFINGALRTTANLGIYTARTSYNLFFGNLPSDAGFFRGMLDEVSLYNRPLNAQEVYDIFNSGAIGKCPKDLNQAPLVDAGPNLDLPSVSDVAALNGLVNDDGLPTGAGLRVNWSKVDGPGTVVFGDASAAVTTATFGAAGIYVLRLTADDAAVVRSDVVEVRVAVPCSTAPSGLVAWWPGNHSAQEVIAGRDGLLAGGTTFASGRVSSAFSFDGTNDSVHVAAHPSLDVGQGGGLTVEFWMNPADVTRNGRIVGWHSGLAAGGTNFGVNVQMLGRTVNAQIYDLAGAAHDVNLANALTNNTWAHVVVTYDPAAGQGRIYFNGALRTTVAVGSYTARTGYRLFFGNVPFDPNFYRGLLDEVSIYDRALTSNEVVTAFAAGAAGKCPPAPVSPAFVQELSSSESVATITENENGQRIAMSDASGTTTYSYDAAGRVSRVAKSWSAHAGAPAIETSLVYEYDDLGRFVGVHSSNLNGASMRYVWNDLNHLLEVVDPHSGSTVYHHDAAGKAVSYTYPDGVTGSRFGVLDNVACHDEPGATVVCDADGNRVRRTVTDGSRTITTYFVVSPLTVTGAAQVVEELTFDSANPLLATPAVTRVYVHGLHTISLEELVHGDWQLSFFE